MPKAGTSPESDGARILVCGWAGARNMGDELLTEWVVHQIEAVGGRALLTTRSFEDTRRRHPSVTPVGWRLRDLLVVLRRVDGVCVGPGGIIQDGTSLWSLPGHLAKPMVGRLRRLPVAGVGLGAEPLTRRSSRWLLSRALADPVGVVGRDEMSVTAMNDAGVAADVAPDLVFGIDRLGHDGCREEIVVAIGPRVRPGRWTTAARRLDYGDLDEAAASLESLSRRLDAPMAVAAFRGDADLDYAGRLVDRLADRARHVTADPVAIREAIARARLVVSSRYHAAVLGLVEGVPVLVRSDQAKLGSLAHQIGDEARILALPSWSELADAEVADPFDRGVVPGSVKRHQEVLRALVDEAARRRR